MVKEDILKQHKQIFMAAVHELATNNTNSLIEDDIINGVIEVPLEAMDTVKQRVTNIAKHNDLILESDKFNEVLSSFKESLKKRFREIFKKRIELIENNYKNLNEEKPLELIKNLKKDLVKFNKEIKKDEKIILTTIVKEKLIDNLSIVVKSSSPNFIKDATKFLQTTYIKQVIETIDMKILVKDTILLNSFKEQIERYVFTKENSHLFD